MADQENKHELAKKIGKGKADFVRHLGTYAIVMVILAVINNVTEPGGYQWWLWPAGIWGVFVVINFLSAFVFKAGTFEKLEERYTQQELEKMEREE
jgi:uncharacterized membrane protein YdcZ (DUF606 family)